MAETEKRVFDVFYKRPSGEYVYIRTVSVEHDLPAGSEKMSDTDALEHVFWQMQGENWSPHGEAREMIRALGLTHTSMYVGDIVRETHAGNIWLCANEGWEVLANFPS